MKLADSKRVRLRDGSVVDLKIAPNLLPGMKHVFEYDVTLRPVEAGTMGAATLARVCREGGFSFSVRA